MMATSCFGKCYASLELFGAIMLKEEGSLEKSSYPSLAAASRMLSAFACALASPRTASSLLPANASDAASPPAPPHEEAGQPRRGLDSANNDTLVILLGNARGGEDTWRSLYTHLLDAEQADLALAFGDAAQFEDTSLSSRAKHIWVMKEPADWGDVLDQAAVSLGIDPQLWRGAFDLFPDNGLYGPALRNGVESKGSGGLIFALRYLLLHNTAAPEVLTTYKRVVLTRSDHMYMCDHAPASPGQDEVHIPVAGKDDWGELTDRHHVFRSEDAQHAMGELDWLLQQSASSLTAFAHNINPEFVVKESFRANGLTSVRFPRTMFTVATANDTTRWQTADGDVPGYPGLQLKYKHEFALATKECGPARAAEWMQKYKALFTRRADRAAMDDIFARVVAEDRSLSTRPAHVQQKPAQQQTDGEQQQQADGDAREERVAERRDAARRGRVADRTEERLSGAIQRLGCSRFCEGGDLSEIGQELRQAGEFICMEMNATGATPDTDGCVQGAKVTPERLDPTAEFLSKVLPAEHTVVLACLGDGFSMGRSKVAMLRREGFHMLAFCAECSRDDVVLVPDFAFLRDGGHAQLNAEVDQYSQQVPWPNKRRVFSFRGSTTGHVPPNSTREGLMVNDRLRAALKAREECAECHPEDFDIGVVTNDDGLFAQLENVTGVPMEVPAAIRSYGLQRNRTAISEEATARVLLDIDGNTNSWSALWWKLRSNSVVVKMESPYCQWYYSRLEAGKHYLPLAASLANLESVRRYTLDSANDQALQSVALAATQLTQTLTVQDGLEGLRDALQSRDRAHAVRARR